MAEIQLTGFVVRFINDWRLSCNFHCLAAGLAFVLPVAGQSSRAQKCLARQGAPRRGCPTEALPFQHSCLERAGHPSQGISFASVAKPLFLNNRSELDASFGYRILWSVWLCYFQWFLFVCFLLSPTWCCRWTWGFASTTVVQTAHAGKLCSCSCTATSCLQGMGHSRSVLLPQFSPGGSEKTVSGKISHNTVLFRQLCALADSTSLWCWLAWQMFIA